jgi:hypothetical protein
MPIHCLRALSTSLLAAALAGCAALAPPDIRIGQTEADLRPMLGQATARYSMPAAVTRLEYATGPYGRSTWMVDLDDAGRVTGARQVLTEASFADFQARAPGMTRDELLRTLGRPGERRHGGWQGGEVWSWRYPTNDCLWFQVSISDAGAVRDGAFGLDPMCSSPADAHN